jgi:hypothetical protein
MPRAIVAAILVALAALVTACGGATPNAAHHSATYTACVNQLVAEVENGNGAAIPTACDSLPYSQYTRAADAAQLKEDQAGYGG